MTPGPGRRRRTADPAGARHRTCAPAGYEVDLAADAVRTALELAARHHPDVVVLDLGLPGIDGIDVIDGLRGWTEVPIIVLSVRDAERDKVAALDAGADDYVTKPFGMDELLARMRAALRRRDAGRRAAPIVDDPRLHRSTSRPSGCRPRPGRGAAHADRVGTSSRCSSATRASSSPSASSSRRCGARSTSTRRTTCASTWRTIRRKLEPDPLDPALLHHRARHGLPVRAGVRGLNADLFLPVTWPSCRSGRSRAPRSSRRGRSPSGRRSSCRRR